MHAMYFKSLSDWIMANDVYQANLHLIG